MNRMQRIVCVMGLSALLVFPAHATGQEKTRPAPDAREERSPQVRLEEYVERADAFGFSGAVLVMRGEDVLVKAGCGLADRGRRSANTPETLFDIGAVTECFTAAAIIKLESAKTLKTRDTIDQFLPDVPDDKRSITIHQLLTHTSGLRNIEILGDGLSDRREAVRQIMATPLDFEPGKQWRHSNAGYHILAAILEEVTSEKFEDHLKRLIFEPARMNQTGFIGDESVAGRRVATGYTPAAPGGAVGRADERPYNWNLRGCGGILTSIEDLERWENALRGASLLSAAEQDKLFRKHVATSQPGVDYGYGWEIAEDYLGIRRHFVGHGSNTRGFECRFLHFPQDHIAVAVCANNNRGESAFLPGHILAILFDRPAQFPPPVATVPPESMRRAEGSYVTDEGLEFTLAADERALTVAPRNQATLELFLSWGEAPASRRSAALADEANRRADAVIRAWARKNLARLEPMCDHKPSEWVRQLCESLDGQAAERGGYKDHRVIGTTGDDGTVRTLVDLRFEEGRAIASLVWNKSLLAHVEFPAEREPALRFVAESARRFNAFDLATSRSMTFDLDEQATPPGLKFRAGRARPVEFLKRAAKP